MTRILKSTKIPTFKNHVLTFIYKLLRKSKSALRKLTVSSKKKYLKQSYSQSGEDLIVKFIFDYLGIKNPSYIDIGAHHPYFISNTALFYNNGSRGINIEPDPDLFKEFPKHRKEDINVNIGISTSSKFLDFYMISSSTLNTFSKEEAYNYSKEGNFTIENIIKIEVNTISHILKKYNQGVFPQYLSLDAEGVDEIIIREIDFAENFPLVICIETISFSTSGNGNKNNKLIEYIISKGYILYADTNINSIFVRKEIWCK